jgi:hypothetical protein
MFKIKKSRLLITVVFCVFIANGSMASEMLAPISDWSLGQNAEITSDRTCSVRANFQGGASVELMGEKGFLTGIRFKLPESKIQAGWNGNAEIRLVPSDKLFKVPAASEALESGLFADFSKSPDGGLLLSRSVVLYLDVSNESYVFSLSGITKGIRRVQSCSDLDWRAMQQAYDFKDAPVSSSAVSKKVEGSALKINLYPLSPAMKEQAVVEKLPKPEKTEIVLSYKNIEVPPITEPEIVAEVQPVMPEVVQPSSPKIATPSMILQPEIEPQESMAEAEKVSEKELVEAKPKEEPPVPENAKVVESAEDLKIPPAFDSSKLAAVTAKEMEIEQKSLMGKKNKNSAIKPSETSNPASGLEGDKVKPAKNSMPTERLGLQKIKTELPPGPIERLAHKNDLGETIYWMSDESPKSPESAAPEKKPEPEVIEAISEPAVMEIAPEPEVVQMAPEQPQVAEIKAPVKSSEIEVLQQSDKAEVIKWRAVKGSSLREVMALWSADAGVQLVWDTDQQYNVMETIEVADDFQSAVVKLLNQFSESAYKTRPIGELFQDPSTKERVLVVRSNAS